jgi:hypothetical protein
MAGNAEAPRLAPNRTSPPLCRTHVGGLRGALRVKKTAMAGSRTRLGRLTAFAGGLLVAAVLLGASATAAGPPTATTGPAVSLTSSSANVSGTVNPNGQETTYSFQYGTTTAYGFQTNSQSAGAGTQDQVVSGTLTGLASGTTYHYRLIATNASGTTVGADMTFTTLGSPPPPPVVAAADGYDHLRHLDRPNDRNSSRQDQPEGSRHDLLLRVRPHVRIWKPHRFEDTRRRQQDAIGQREAQRPASRLHISLPRGRDQCERDGTRK